MSREAVYHGIILKKQPLGDADEIITFFTQEAGKVRGVAKSVKLAKSKLQNALQGLFYVRLVLAQGSRSGSSAMHKVIRSEVLDTFMSLRGSLSATQAGLFAAEAVYKATPDEHKNTKLFKLLLDFLQSLNRLPDAGPAVYGLLAKFEIGLLENLGFGLRLPEAAGLSGQVLYFTQQGGGFAWEARENDRVKVDPGLYEAFGKLRTGDFASAAAAETGSARELGHLLAGFLEYHLERKLHARRLFL